MKKAGEVKWGKPDSIQKVLKNGWYRTTMLMVACLSLQQAGAQVTNFVLASSPQVIPGSVAVAVADVNGDGKPDLIGVGTTPNTLSGTELTVLTNNGNGSFGFNAQSSVGREVFSVTAADVNEDGHPDLVVADFGSGVIVLTNNGSGTFGINARIHVVMPRDVAVVDVNADGLPDLVSINGAGTFNVATLTVLTNNGSDMFAFSDTLNAGSTILGRDVVVADVNQDGRPDLIYPNTAGAVEIWTNSGLGTFGFNASVNVGGTPQWVTAADVNQDGQRDLISASQAGYLTVLTNNGLGVFGSNATLTVSPPAFVTTGDVNSDGKPDLICASPDSLGGGGLPAGGDDTLTIFTNNGAGQFGLDAKLDTGGTPDALAAADVNGDGQLDLVSANSSAYDLLVFTNTIVPGHTAFALTSTTVINSASSLGAIPPQSATALDVNGNGKPDLIAVDDATEALVVLTNNGAGLFTSNAIITADKAQPYGIVATDVNGDGKPDLVAVNYGSGSTDTLTVLTNNGGGEFLADTTLTVVSTNSPVGPGTRFVTAADVNRDGKPDLICANENDNSLTLFTNAGNGSFGSNATLSVGLSPKWIVSVDVNGDGSPDLVSANYGDTTLTILTNNSTGVFGSNATLQVGSSPDSVAAVDVNQDGKLDLVSADFAGGSLTILTNAGGGVFGSNATIHVGLTPTVVAAADLNHDGLPDLLCLNPQVGGLPSGDNTLTVLTNDGSGGFDLEGKLTPGGIPSSVITADVNADGRLDLVTANSDSSFSKRDAVAVFLNVPLLDIHAQTNGVSLAWPFPSSGFVLQQNADLGSTHWSDVTSTTEFIGGQNQVTIPSSAGESFFRLIQP